MWIYAETGTNAMTWKLYMYADGTNYLGYFAGSASNGVIDIVWNLVGPGGTKLTNEFYRGEFEITRSGPGLMGNPPTTTFNWTMEKQWTDDSRFVIAFSKPSDDFNSEDRARDMVSDGVVDIVAAANYTVSPGNSVQGGTVYSFHNNDSGFQLLEYLKDPSYRNFYYFGHGSRTSFGTVGTNGTLRARDIGIHLQNLTGIVTNNTSANKKPFRFVFIDGCSAGSPEMAQAFGIPGIQADRAYFRLNNKVRSRAFLGFKDKVPFTPSNWTTRAEMLGFFYNLWLTGRPLHECVSRTQTRSGSGEAKMPLSAVIFGATDFRTDGL